jgi:hypothetical protein
LGLERRGGAHLHAASSGQSAFAQGRLPRYLRRSDQLDLSVAITTTVRRSRGLGINPPLHPHHRPSQADGIDNPWPGLAGRRRQQHLHPGGRSSNKNGATNWTDDVNDYELNEVAINWNAPLTYALASFLDAYAGSSTNLDAAITSDDARSGTGGSTGAGGTGGSPAKDAASASGGVGGNSGSVGGSTGSGGSSGAGGKANGGAGGSPSGVGGSASAGAGGNVSSGAGGSASGGTAGSGGSNSGGSVGSSSNPGSATKTSSAGGCSCALGGAVSTPASLLIFPALAVVCGFLRIRRRRG